METIEINIAIIVIAFSATVTQTINIKNRGTKMNLSCPGLSCPPNLSQILNFGKNRKFLNLKSLTLAKSQF